MDRAIIVGTLHSRTIILWFFQYFPEGNSSLEVNFWVVFRIKLFRCCSTFSPMSALDPKILFTDCCSWQNFRPSLFCLVNNYVESIYMTQKTRTKVEIGWKWILKFILDRKTVIACQLMIQLLIASIGFGWVKR